MSRLHPRPVSMALAVGLLALVAPAAASAGGFGAPVAISGSDDASEPLVAMAPTGRTAVVYTRYRGSREERRIALGPEPDRLAPPVTLTLPGPTRGELAPSASFDVRGDGGVVVCLAKLGRRGCRIASPTGKLGPFIPLAGRSGPPAILMRPDGSALLLSVSDRPERLGPRTRATTTVRPLGSDGHLGTPQVLFARATAEQAARWSQTLQAFIRPDGSIVVLRSLHRYAGRGSRFTTRVVAADGTLGPERLVEAAGDGGAYVAQPVALDDGTVVVVADEPDPARQGRTLPALRTMPPGTDAFGPVTPLPARGTDEGVDLEGGPALTISWRASYGWDGGAGERRMIQRRPDGSFGPILSAPGSSPGEVGGGEVVLPGGGIVSANAYTQRDSGYPDCEYLDSGVVRAGVPLPVGTANPGQRLSAPRQLALDPQTVALADGTVITSWENGAGERGTRRLEAAVRPAHADRYGPGQPLPRLAFFRYETTLVAAGNRAALVWRSASPGRGNRSTIQVSAYRSAGPYATRAPLPRHPSTTCDG